MFKKRSELMKVGKVLPAVTQHSAVSWSLTHIHAICECELINHTLLVHLSPARSVSWMSATRSTTRFLWTAHGTLNLALLGLSTAVIVLGNTTGGAIAQLWWGGRHSRTAFLDVVSLWNFSFPCNGSFSFPCNYPTPVATLKKVATIAQRHS